MILSATLSKPTAAVRDALGNDFIRIKIKLHTASKVAVGNGASAQEAHTPVYAAELFTKTQVFHKKLTAQEVDAFLAAHAGTTFHSCVERTETEEITLLANKKGRLTRLAKPIKTNGADQAAGMFRTKNYILREGVPVPFLVHLGVMTAQGKVLAAKYDKFKQINRFLEYVDDVLGDVLSVRAKANRPISKENPLRVVDFGSGKSYLTFAVHYFLTAIRALDCDITGLDLKEDVIAYCNDLARQCACNNLHFAVGDIASYGESAAPDIVITLHACDTATDYALDYAVQHQTTAILSVPCCQHELNAQLSYSRVGQASDAQAELLPFAPLLKHGIVKERFAALATDALRAAYLEAAGYRVQVLEFIDMTHTPKNLLIRAVRKQGAAAENTLAQADALTNALGVSQTLGKLLGF